MGQAEVSPALARLAVGALNRPYVGHILDLPKKGAIYVSAKNYTERARCLRRRGGRDSRSARCSPAAPISTMDRRDTIALPAATRSPPTRSRRSIDPWPQHSGNTNYRDQRPTDAVRRSSATARNKVTPPVSPTHCRAAIRR